MLTWSAAADANHSSPAAVVVATTKKKTVDALRRLCSLVAIRRRQLQTKTSLTTTPTRRHPRAIPAIRAGDCDLIIIIIVTFFNKQLLHAGKRK